MCSPKSCLSFRLTPDLVLQITTLPAFIPPSKPRHQEREAILGPLLRLSTFADTFPAFARENFTLPLPSSIKAAPEEDQADPTTGMLNHPLLGGAGGGGEGTGPGSKPKAVTREELEDRYSSLRHTLHTLRGQTFTLVNALVRSGGPGRENVLRFLGAWCELNAGRDRMRIDPHQVGTDGMAVGAWDLVRALTAPYVDKINTGEVDRFVARVDPLWWAAQVRFPAKPDDLTRLSASAPEVATWVSEVQGEVAQFSFVTETYFLATRVLTLGPGRVLREYDDMYKTMSRLRERIEDGERSRPQWTGNRMYAAQMRLFLSRARSEYGRLQVTHAAMAAHIFDGAPRQTAYDAAAGESADGFLPRLVSFAAFSIRFLLSVAQSSSKGLPLNKDQVPATFKMLPEYILTDAADIMRFVARHRPALLTAPARNALVSLTLALLSPAGDTYVRNPFVKARLAETLYYILEANSPSPMFGSPEAALGSPTPRGPLADTLNLSPDSVRLLVPALMHFWIAAETTGSHTQFYDKFEIRSHLSRVFDAIWDNPAHLRRIDDVAHAAGVATISDTVAPTSGPTDGSSSGGNAALISEEEDGLFVTFVNRIMNDVTFLLDDALTKLVELHNAQVKVADIEAGRLPAGVPVEAPPGGASNERRGETPRTALEQAQDSVRQLEGQVKWMLHYGGLFLGVLGRFAAHSPQTFLLPELADRLAAMLDYVLGLLAGPRTESLKVQDPKSVGFHPRVLLQSLLQIYVALSQQAACRALLAAALARDGRSYDARVFHKAAALARKHMLLPPTGIDTLAVLVRDAEANREADAALDEDLADAPDEFLDPLMATLMRDPVMLPASRMVMDRATIKQHLLSDPSDPFNRMPLALADVIPQHELKTQIEAWLQEVRARRG